MIPIKDTVRAREFPVVTAALIAANVLVWALELSLGTRGLEDLVWRLGVVPERFLRSPLPFEWVTLLTSQFLHGSWFHLGSNMIALYIFGDNVEDRLGHLKFLLFYLLCGVGAGVTHILLNSSSAVPAIGASGAISGVMAAYLVLFPLAQVVTLTFFFFLPLFVEVPAVLWIAIWFLSQLLNGLFSLAVGEVMLGGVAWWAHVGGFLTGLVLARPLSRPAYRYHPDEYWPW